MRKWGSFPTSVGNVKVKLDLKYVFKFFNKYLKTHTNLFVLAVFLALFSVFFNIFIIIGFGDLSSIVALSTSPKGMFKEGDNQLLLYFSIIMLLACLANALFYWFAVLLNVYISYKIGFQLRMDLFNKTQVLSVFFLDKQKSGEIMSVLINDVYNFIVFIAQNFATIIQGLILSLSMFVLLLLISPYITLIILLFIFCLWLLAFYFVKTSNISFLNRQSALGKMNAFVEETISGQKIIDYFHAQKKIIADFQKIQQHFAQSSKRSQIHSGVLIPFVIVMMNASVVLIVILSLVFIIQDLPFGSSISDVSWIRHWLPKTADSFTNQTSNRIFEKLNLVTVLLLAVRNFIQPINQIIASVPFFQAAYASLNKMKQIFEQPNENQTFETQVIPHQLAGKIEFVKVSFGYQPNEMVLRDISFMINPNETVAIVGPTGSGKTTIINLLNKFYDIQKGTIFLDGYDLKTLQKKMVRAQMTMVFQDPYLFSGSIYDNFVNIKPDITYEEMVQICQKASCHDFISKLKNGYHTILSENAQKLSIGQKQLIAIALAMSLPAKILILDEATANIDTRTEKLIQKAMVNLFKNKTVIVIAHRLSTVRNADKIIVLKNGSILEMGNHDSLMTQKGFYYNLNISKTEDLDTQE